MLQEAQLGPFITGDLVHHPRPFITQLEATDSLKFAITHDRPLLSHKLIVRNTCKVAMVFSEFQKGMTINIMHRTKHMVDNTTMEQLKIPQVQNIITKEHISVASQGKSTTLGYNHTISVSAKSLTFIYNNNQKKDSRLTLSSQNPQT